jgi:hypothetical protein
VNRGRTVLRPYGFTFVRLTTWAVHIEVANSLETDSFIQVLMPFIAWRGNPELLRSDNGTNFVEAKNELKKSIKSWDQVTIDAALKQRDIQQ